MNAAGAVTFHDLTPETQLVLRACAVLNHSSLSQLAVAAVLPGAPSRAGGVFVELAAAGWGVVVDDRLDITPDSRSFLQRLVRQTPPGDVHAVIDTIAAAVEQVIADGAPLSTGVRDDLLGVLRAANLYDMPQVAVQVARSALDVLSSRPGGSDTVDPGVDPGSDLSWWRGVVEEGEQAAGRTRQPWLLAELLDRSARLYSAAGDWQAAEAAWIRALYLMSKLGDRDEYVRYLELLASTYHDAGQVTAFATTLEELVERYERDAKPDQAASALARLGATLLHTGQLAGAIRYLGQAERLLADLPETTDRRIRRAGILSDLGRAHARRDAINRAWTCYREALTLVVDATTTIRSTGWWNRRSPCFTSSDASPNAGNGVPASTTASSLSPPASSAGDDSEHQRVGSSKVILAASARWVRRG